MAERYSTELKRKVLIELLVDRKSIAFLSRKYGIHPATISKWEKEGLTPAKTGEDKKELFQKLFRQVPLGNQKMALNLVRNWGLNVGINYLNLVLNPRYLTSNQTKLGKRPDTNPDIDSTKSFEEEE